MFTMKSKPVGTENVSTEKKNLNMKRLFRRNQIIITTLAVMIAVAGYLNYVGKQSLSNGDLYEAGMMEISDEDILSENHTLAVIDSLDNEPSDISDTEQAKQTGLENPGEAILTSGMSVSDYIANVQMSREQVRAKNKESLMEIINNTELDETAKSAAVQEMIEMTAIVEKENSAETLLMAKGFSDPVVSITADKADVVINSPSITDQERAQIEDIVKRKAEVSADGIIITLMDLSE